MVDWERVRLHIVTGKGGTGKTTVSAALALALAAGGRRVLLVEVEGRQGFASLFDSPPLPYEERKVAVAADGGDVFALAIDAQDAVLEYLQMFYRLGRAGKALDRMGALEFATTIAPGLRDVLMTGKTYEAARRRGTGGGFAYDAIVMDAPPTGRVTRFLNVNEEVTELTRVGPINRQADSIMSLFRSPATAVHVVTVLEEMPVQETADGIAELTAARLPVGAIVVNQVRPSPLPEPALVAAQSGSVDTEALRAGLVAGDLADLPHMTDDLVDAWAAGLRAEVIDHAHRVTLEQEQAERLAAIGTAADHVAEAGRGHRPRLSVHAGADACATGVSAAGTGGQADDPVVDAAPSTTLRRRHTAGRPGHPDRRLLRVRRRGQDDDRRGAGPARSRAWTTDGRAHHRPGPPPCSVDGSGRARQLPPHRGRRRRDRRWLAGRDDAGHEAHLRRGGARPRPDPTKQPPILDNPFYQALSTSFAGTQEYMAMEKLGQLRAPRTPGT